MAEHKLHLYTGNGKGKTTAAMGLALRAHGHGLPVLITQFLKDGHSGEITALSHLPGVTMMLPRPTHGFVFQMTAAEKAGVFALQTAHAHALCDYLRNPFHMQNGLLVLDELATALSLHMVEEDTARMLIAAALQRGEAVVSGYAAPPWLHAAADYVSVITAEKHPYETEHLPAREGIEW